MNPFATPEIRAFHDEVRSFLAEHLAPDVARATRATSVFTDPSVSLPWQAILHARGWATPTGRWSTAAPAGTTSGATSSPRKPPAPARPACRRWG
ncbi:hypothetical protein AB5I41_12510 [Sphingomonas sp. MMS24-JH45]